MTSLESRIDKIADSAMKVGYYQAVGDAIRCLRDTRYEDALKDVLGDLQALRAPDSLAEVVSRTKAMVVANDAAQGLYGPPRASEGYV